jgi:hypothetical protein
MPGFDSLTNGDVSSKRRMAGEMLQGFYQSCFEADSGTGTPFAADAIISNPPAFAGLHVAESLGLPLLMSFSKKEEIVLVLTSAMPWSPTNLFPHPLVNIQASNAGKGLTNYLSYALADTLYVCSVLVVADRSIWQGLGDIMNKFRHQLGLAPLSALTGPMALERLATPCLYAWSPSLLPKPDEWREHIGALQAIPQLTLQILQGSSPSQARFPTRLTRSWPHSSPQANPRCISALARL